MTTTILAEEAETRIEELDWANDDYGWGDNLGFWLQENIPIVHAVGRETVSHISHEASVTSGRIIATCGRVARTLDDRVDHAVGMALDQVIGPAQGAVMILTSLPFLHRRSKIIICS